MEVLDLLLTFQFNSRLESFIAKFKTADLAAKGLKGAHSLLVPLLNEIYDPFDITKYVYPNHLLFWPSKRSSSLKPIPTLLYSTFIGEFNNLPLPRQVLPPSPASNIYITNFYLLSGLHISMIEFMHWLTRSFK